MPTCKAIVQEGSRRGQQCSFMLPDDSVDTYCGRHQRNKKYDEGIAEGKRWCRFFFRGCDNDISDQPQKLTSCQSCRDKKKARPTCQHTECTFQAIDKELFCGQHLRDKYRLEEVEKGIKYCDVDRGCFNIPEEGRASCEVCLQKERDLTKTLRDARIAQNIMIASTNSTNQRLCVKCNKEFEYFKTTKGKESQKCPSCFETQVKVELLREKRDRNYKRERMINIKTHYTMYITAAIKRNKDFLLQFDEFCNVVIKPCYYCDYYKEDEVNGIDRLDNDKHYTLDNCVPCCEICNRMKHYYHPIFFIDKCKIICGTLKASPEFFKKWNNYYSRNTNHQFNAYKKEAESRGLAFNITEKEYNKLVYSQCYMCGYSQRQGIGIDRFDNTIRSYDMENCRPCCGTCNLSKSDFKYTDIIIKCAQVSEKWKDTSALEGILVPSNPFKSKIVKPVNEIQWRAITIYNAIKSNNQHEYYNTISDYATTDDIDELVKAVLKEELKEESIKIIQKFIAKLNKRRKLWNAEAAAINILNRQVGAQLLQLG